MRDLETLYKTELSFFESFWHDELLLAYTKDKKFKLYRGVLDFDLINNCNSIKQHA